MMEQQPHPNLKEDVWDIILGAGEQCRFEDYMGLVFIENQNKIYTPLLLTMKDPVARGNQQDFLMFCHVVSRIMDSGAETMPCKPSAIRYFVLGKYRTMIVDHQIKFQAKFAVI